MGISRATYYHQSIRGERQTTRDMELRGWIEEIHLELPGYGYRRIRHHLLREGKRVNGKRIQRVMKKYSLLSCLQRMMKTRGEKVGIKLFYPNLIRGMKINGPNQVWATDLTYSTPSRSGPAGCRKERTSMNGMRVLTKGVYKYSTTLCYEGV